MKYIATLSMVAVAALSSAQSFVQNFDDVTTLAGDGWAQNNLSDSAINQGPYGAWFQGNNHAAVTGGVNTSSDFPAFNGATNAYIGTIFAVTNAGTGVTLSNWLITPERLLNNGDTFSFYSRTNTFGGTTIYPDRLQLRLSLSGASTNVGATSASVGDFTTVLQDINPTLTTTGYPTTWTQYTTTITGLSGPTSGRFGFRYFVTDGGPVGNNSGRIGIDGVEYNSAVPEPATMAALGLGLAAVARRRRSK